jgi:phage/plasmid-like protein (TIGR03299 family)
MSHELTIRADGSAEMAWLSDEGTPWHGLGSEMLPGMTLDEWKEKAGLNHKILRVPITFTIGEHTHTFKNRFALVREDNKFQLGIVSAGYKVVQPEQVIDAFRDLVQDFGLELVTAGTLYGGTKYWALARYGKAEAIRDGADKVGKYLLLWTSADGKTGNNWQDTTIRVVCRNTLAVAISQTGLARFSSTHHKEFDPAAAKAALGLHLKDAGCRFAATMDAFRRMAATPVSPATALRITLESFGFDVVGMKRKEIEDAAARPTIAPILGMAMTGNGLMGNGLDGGEGTVWAVLNAITQGVDHKRSAASDSARLNSAWFGEGAKIKRRALKYANLYAGVKDDAPIPDQTIEEQELEAVEA